MDFQLQIAARHNDQGEAIWFLDALSIIKLTGAQTGGAFSLIDETFAAGRRTPYHLHHREDETFYVLEGQATFFSGSQQIKGTPGSVIFLPRMIPHGFRTDAPGRILILTTPAGFDEFVVEAGEPAETLELPRPQEHDFGRLAELAAKYDIDILGPLPE